jgi:CRP/FNR family cyclic AMP-dependent transcriptional regulator
MSPYKYSVSTIYATRLRLSADSGVAEPVRFGLFGIKAYAVGWCTHEIVIWALVRSPRRAGLHCATEDSPDRHAPCCGHVGESECHGSGVEVLAILNGTDRREPITQAASFTAHRIRTEENIMKSGTEDEAKGKTKKRLGKLRRDPTLEGNDEDKVGRVQEKIGSVDWESLLNGIFRGKTVIECGMDRTIFQQGQPADSLFYIRRGKVKLTVISQQGKEAIIAILSAGEFFGEGCLTGQPLRMATAVAMTDCNLDKIEKSLMVRMLHEHHDVSELFITHLLSRNIRYEADLVDQLFNSSEKRLARILLLLSHFGKESRVEPVLPGVSQDSLAQMVGTTRSRVSHFMNKFRKLGFIDYSDSDELTVHSSLLNVVLHD